MTYDLRLKPLALAHALSGNGRAGLLGGVAIAWWMKPVADHLQLPQEHSAGMHLWHTVPESRYLLAFAMTALVSTAAS